MIKNPVFDILLILNVNHDFIAVVLYPWKYWKFFVATLFIFLNKFNLEIFCASCNFRVLLEILKEEVKVGLVLEVVPETKVLRDLKDILVSVKLH